jgi:hypothetical protein
MAETHNTCGSTDVHFPSPVPRSQEEQILRKHPISSWNTDLTRYSLPESKTSSSNFYFDALFALSEKTTTFSVFVTFFPPHVRFPKTTERMMVELRYFGCTRNFAGLK